ncbi:MAG: WYL domain-containing protein [Agriterribacter sp.]
MSDQPKIQRLLRLLLLLSGNKNYSRKEIAERLEIEERSIYRYLNSLESAGLVLLRQDGYRLAAGNPHTKAINKLFHFSEEEAYILYQLLAGAKGGNAVREKLVRKLHSLYDFKALASLAGKTELEHINALKTAMQDQKQVTLKGYRSSNSQTIQDRHVEAFDFLPEYQGVWCFDLVDKSNKQFLVSRITEVVIQKTGWQYTQHHRIPFTDAFGMSAEAPAVTIKLQLNLKACNLLLEEHPQAKQYLQPAGNEYKVDIPVAGYNGVGRFVLGLPGDVQVIAPVAFKRFLEKEVENVRW